MAALTGSLDDLRLSRRSRSPSPLLYRPSLRERYGLRPLTPTEKLDLDIRVEQALRRSRSRERLARLELEESRSRSRERRTRLELERARSRSRERMARLDLELAEKRRERLAREELEEVRLTIVGEDHSIDKNCLNKITHQRKQIISYDIMELYFLLICLKFFFHTVFCNLLLLDFSVPAKSPSQVLVL